MKMKLEILPGSRKARVQPSHVIDYERFRSAFAEPEESELHLLEKFYAARALIFGNQPETFVGGAVGDVGNRERQVRVDVAGVGDGEITVVFCETGPPSSEFLKSLSLVDRADNSRAIVMYPFRPNLEFFEDNFGESFDSGKIQVEQLGWGAGGFERTFRQALELMDLLTNETRVRMLTPLLEKPQGKRHYRNEINPKLVYENLTSLLQHHLIDESEEDMYNLTPTGKRILCEYLAFVEKVRRIMDYERQ
jgi:hypothetical protein